MNCWLHSSPCYSIGRSLPDASRPSLNMPLFIHCWRRADWMPATLLITVLTHRCLLGKAPVYLSNCCIPVSQVALRRHLRSAARHQLTIPRHRLSTYGRRAFAVAGPTMFNTLPDDLRNPAVSTSTFRQSLKTHFFSAYQHV